MPPETVCTVDDHEAVSFRWLDPRALVATYAAGGLVLAPPTLVTLEDLAPFSSVSAAADAVALPLLPICPLLVMQDTGVVLALPGDPLHPSRTRVFARRTRIVMGADGRFSSQDPSATGSP